MSTHDIPVYTIDSVEGHRFSPPRVRMGVKALIVNNGNVLMIKERRPSGSCFWSLPGGGVNSGESNKEALNRECREEILCRIKPLGIEGLCRYSHRSQPNLMTVYLVYRCELDGEPVPNGAEAIEDLSWFHNDNLPSGLLQPIRRVIHDANISDRRSAIMDN